MIADKTLARVALLILTNLFVLSGMPAIAGGRANGVPQQPIGKAFTQRKEQRLSRTVGANSEREIFVNQLLQKMTLEEKVGQLNQFAGEMDQTGPNVRAEYKDDIRKGRVGSLLNAYTPSVTHELQRMAVEQTRLHIPLLFAYDVIHGHRTIFPIPLAEAASWDLPLMEETARIAAKEAAADGLHWTFSPMVDVSRDPRWGRVAEGAGEDPWLGSLIAKAKVHGYQGKSLADPNTIMACLKHFAFYGAPEAGRDYNTVDMSRRSMFETYLPPYRAALRAGVATVMTSFNVVDGIPATANQWLVKSLLRGQWNYKGVIITDYNAIDEMVKHRFAKDDRDGARLALNASVDIDMQAAAYHNHLAPLAKQGLVSETQIDESVRRVLLAKYDLGLFKDPYRGVTEERARVTQLHPSHLAVGREIGRQSIVLLKNDNEILPLKAGTKVALIGPLAENQRDVIGTWSAAGDWRRAVSVAKGLESKKDFHLEIRTDKGANLIDDSLLIGRLNSYGAAIELDHRSPAQLIKDAVLLAQNADVIVAVLGESQAMSGEAASRADIGLPSNQQELLRALVQLGKPVVLVLMNGRPLTLTWEHEHVAAIVETWFLGLEAGNSIADVLVGDYNPSGKLTMSFPRHLGQVPIYYANKSTGRPADPNNKYTSKYLDVANDPLFPFGFGLSYTKFVYGDLSLNRSETTISELNKPNSTVRVSLPITNAGERAGTEIVQFYVRDSFASVTRPVKELRGFAKIKLEPGETKVVEFAVKKADLAFYNERMQSVVEPGDFQLMVGPNSAELKEVTFRVNE